MKNFGRFIAVDWSGAEKPSLSGAIALAEARPGSSKIICDEKTRSRMDVANYIENIIKKPARTLVGIDCNFGYAREVGLRQFGRGYTYDRLWRAVERASSNTKGFYAKGFWEHPKFAPYFWTSGKRKNDFMVHRRQTEIACSKQGYGFPESPFKMIGPKQVGKGGLAGMRFALYLKNLHADNVAIWPFEHELANTAHVVITEIYPRIFLKISGHGPKKVTEPAELKEVLAFYGCDMTDLSNFTDHQSDAIVAAAGLKTLCGDNPEVPGDIAQPGLLTKPIAKTEGWIFGVK